MQGRRMRSNVIFMIFLFVLPIVTAPAKLDASSEAETRWERLMDKYEKARQVNRPDEAVKYALQALTLSREQIGAVHPITQVSIHNLAVAYSEMGRYKDAERFSLEAVEMARQMDGDRYRSTLSAKHTLARLYVRQGKLKAGERLLREVLRVSIEELGKQHESIPNTMNSLVHCLILQRRFQEADPLAREAIRIQIALKGETDPQVILFRLNRASIFQNQGRFADAEKIYRKILKLRHRPKGRQHPYSVKAMSYLGFLYYRQGRYSEAEPLLKEVLAYRKRVFGERHPDTLRSMRNLSLLYSRQKRHTEAGRLLQAARQGERLRQDSLPRDHAADLEAQASAYIQQRRFAAAERIYRRLLEEERTPDRLNGLALTLEARGALDQAERLHREAIKTFEKKFGKDHPDALVQNLNLALALARAHKMSAATKYLRKLEPRFAAHARKERFRESREATRRQYANAVLADYRHVVLSLALMVPNSQTERLAAETLFRWKRIQLDEEASFMRLSRTLGARDAKARDLLARRTQIVSRLSTPAADDRAALFTELDVIEQDLRERVQDRTDELGVSADLVDTDDISLRAVRRRLPRGSVLVEFQLFRRAIFGPGDEGDDRIGAIVIHADRNRAKMFQLGFAQPIRKLSGDLKSSNRTKATRASAMLFEELIRPLYDEIGSARAVFIAPDGFLERIPFDRLRLRQGGHWIQYQDIRRVQTGRHLLDKPDKNKPEDRVVVAGNIDYGRFEKNQRPVSRRHCNARLARSRTKNAPHSSCFADLNFSEEETGRIARLYEDLYGQRKVAWLESNEASEEYLMSLKHPVRVLHLATHAFFREAGRHGTPGQERPLLLSGLALAGANRGLLGERNSSGNDGILSALEVTGLNLRGTELVVLSACDTGSGVSDPTEGVYGLVRAFRVAGAHSVLMTLWKVDDWQAANFMIRFHRYWKEHPENGAAAALRRTKRSYINSPDRKKRDPRIWASFVLVESGASMGR